jgi:hypothetical protein
MNRILIAVMAALLALPALADGPTKTTKGKALRPLHGKAQAPVEVTAQLDAGAAKVQVLAQSTASDVEVKIWGVDGLSVTDVQPVPAPLLQLSKGESLTFDVAFAPGPGRSHLVVSVSGKFGGGQRSTVRSFSVGTPTAEQQKSAVPVVTDSKGQRVKLMPANPQ